MKKPRLSESTITKLSNGETVTNRKYEYECKTEWDDTLNAYVEKLYRWDENNDYEVWDIGAWGLWEFKK